MKVVHLCLANFYIDHYSYQENMLPKWHKALGYEVEIITNLVTFDANGKACFLDQGSSYINEYGIPVTRLAFKKPFLKLSRKLKRSVGTYEAVCSAKPDILFIHGCQFLDMKYVVRYVKKRPDVKVYVDNHADLLNSAKNVLSLNILHKFLWRRCAKKIEPYTAKFYGVLPARVDFLSSLYQIPKEKVELLVMGADDEKVLEAQNDNIKKQIRSKYGINDNDFLIMTGGKIDHNKPQTLLLMRAVKNMDNPNIRLLVFGSVTPQLKEEFNALLCDRVGYIGWINSQDTYEYFAAADLVIFPGLHSVFWEQAVGLGKPCVFRHMEGFTHIDLGGNCKFLYHDSAEEMEEIIRGIAENKEEYDKMCMAAQDKGMDMFSYKQIARRSISDK